MSDERTFWKVTAIIEATADEAEAAQEVIARALCPDENHAGECAMPWTMVTCRFEDLTDEERNSWREDLDAERARAREVDEGA